MDTVNNKYYFPDLGGAATVMGYTWEQTAPGVTYVYEADESILNCSGTVTAVEFCFVNSSADDRNLFDLLLLIRLDSNSIQVTKSIPISFHPPSVQCDSSKCCDVMTLTEQDQFNLPTSNFLIGMVIISSLVAPFHNVYPRFETTSYQLSVGRPTANSVLTLSIATTRPLRLMWFHISK